MTKEELLKPRIIALGSDTTETFQKGEIFRQSFNDEHCFISNTGTAVIKHPEKYPHLFKELQWWEERKESDMPEYVGYKLLEDSTEKIIRVEKHFCNSNGEFNDKIFSIDGCPYSYSKCRIATEQEYQNQKP